MSYFTAPSSYQVFEIVHSFTLRAHPDSDETCRLSTRVAVASGHHTGQQALELRPASLLCKGPDDK